MWKTVMTLQGTQLILPDLSW